MCDLESTPTKRHCRTCLIGTSVVEIDPLKAVLKNTPKSQPRQRAEMTSDASIKLRPVLNAKIWLSTGEPQMSENSATLKEKSLAQASAGKHNETNVYKRTQWDTKGHKIPQHYTKARNIGA
jgi:hypothetical protein